MTANNRHGQMTAWLETRHEKPFSVAAASEDASFRRYFRLTREGVSRIVMDAPPDLESCDAFVKVAHQLRGAGLHAPEIFAEDRQQGFLLLEDLGQRTYLEALSEQTVDALYGDALQAQRKFCQLPTDGLPVFDQQLICDELALFRDWYIAEARALSPAEANFCLQPLQSILIENALAQPRVWVHRDYHSRNLMVCQPNPGILDFQDAVAGPLTYDAVSLLKDCYIRWPRAKVETWLEAHYRQLQLTDLASQLPEFGQFLTWFELMGVQRHLKAIGIFARLNHRDGKSGYLADIPRCLEYLAEQADRCKPLAQLLAWLEQQQ
ncbi:MAG: phosphotransferase [Gammaproteobacteria bacterium]